TLVHYNLRAANPAVNPPFGMPTNPGQSRDRLPPATQAIHRRTVAGEGLKPGARTGRPACPHILELAAGGSRRPGGASVVVRRRGQSDPGGGCVPMSADVTIIRLDAVLADRLAGLIAEAEEAGVRFVRRLVEEWEGGANRFSRPGEALFAAVDGDGRI